MRHQCPHVIKAECSLPPTLKHKFHINKIACNKEEGESLGTRLNTIVYE